jgi:hypothetical protein
VPDDDEKPRGDHPLPEPYRVKKGIQMEARNMLSVSGAHSQAESVSMWVHPRVTGRQIVESASGRNSPATHFNLGRHHAIRNRVHSRGRIVRALAAGDGGMTGYDWFKVPTYKPVVPESRRQKEWSEKRREAINGEYDANQTGKQKALPIELEADPDCDP